MRPTPTTALAAAVRQVPAIAALQELWQQRSAEGETDADYWAFHDWLDKGANRGAPTGASAALAVRYEWSQRALAFERAADLQKTANAGGVAAGAPEQQVIDHLTSMVQLEVAKLLKASASEAAPTASLKDLLATVNLIAELRVKAISAQSSRVDMSKLTADEIKIVLKAQDILRRAGGK